jgi:taurine dioxygenase
VSSKLTIDALTPTIGAEVSGVDLTKPLDATTVEALRAAWLTHQVLFFRDQHIDFDQHRRFCEYFGEIDIPPFHSAGSEHPELTILDQTEPKGQGADSWHSDITHRPEPPKGSILRAVQLPPHGGDTCFSSMTAAYDDLSAPMRAFLDGLHAEHTMQIQAERARIRTPEARLLDVGSDGYPTFVHPVVRVHPETGRKLINVNANFTSRIVDLSESEGVALLRFLLEHVKSPDYQCRFRWAPGSIAFWDNRAVQHFAVADYNERRIMQRITIKGDRPAGPLAA